MIDTSPAPKAKPQNLTGDAARAELTTLARKRLELADSTTPKIDDLIDEATLHMYDPHMVADVAMDLGLTVVQCCMCRDYKANGVWLNDTNRVTGYSQLSHSFCEPCETEYRDKWNIHPAEAPAQPEPAVYHH